jgi:hypothetical protein
MDGGEFAGDAGMVRHRLPQHRIARAAGHHLSARKRDRQIAGRDHLRTLRGHDRDSATGRDRPDGSRQGRHALGVQAGVGRVEQHQRRVAIQRAGQGQPLDLPGRQGRLSMSQNGVQTRRQGADQRRGPRRIQRGRDPRRIGAWIAAGDGLGEGPGRQGRAFRQVAKGQSRSRPAGQILAPQPHLSRSDGPGARKRAQQRRLARTRRTDDRQRLPRRHVHRHPAQHRCCPAPCRRPGRHDGKIPHGQVRRLARARVWRGPHRRGIGRHRLQQRPQSQPGQPGPRRQPGLRQNRVHWCQGAPRKHHRRHDPARAELPAQHQRRGQSQHRRLQPVAQTPRQRRHAACGIGPVECRPPRPPPRRQPAGGQPRLGGHAPQRPGCGGHRGGQPVDVGHGPRLDRRGAARPDTPGHRQPHKDQNPRKRQGTQRRMQHPDRQQEHRHEGQVAQSDRQRRGQRHAQRLQIPQGLGRASRGAGCGMAQGRVQGGTLDPGSQPQGDARKDALAQQVKPGHRPEQQRHQHRQRHQRLGRAGRQDAVIDLQHVQRPGEQQHIARCPEGKSGRQGRALPPQRRPKPAPPVAVQTVRQDPPGATRQPPSPRRIGHPADRVADRGKHFLDGHRQGTAQPSRTGAMPIDANHSPLTGIGREKRHVSSATCCFDDNNSCQPPARRLTPYGQEARTPDRHKAVTVGGAEGPG